MFQLNKLMLVFYSGPIWKSGCSKLKILRLEVGTTTHLLKYLWIQFNSFWRFWRRSVQFKLKLGKVFQELEPYNRISIDFLPVPSPNFQRLEVVVVVVEGEKNNWNVGSWNWKLCIHPFPKLHRQRVPCHVNIDSSLGNLEAGFGFGFSFGTFLLLRFNESEMLKCNAMLCFFGTVQINYFQVQLRSRQRRL